ncbi:hypothetical protein B5S33_g5600 [[Candida] boidinii]|nr:hypothetical protein B5S33_g5600 [[Candida] boidinii]
MHIILLRHGSRIDKKTSYLYLDKLGRGGNFVDSVSDFSRFNSKNTNSQGVSIDSSSWLSTFDPPLDLPVAEKEMEIAFKKISTHVKFATTRKKNKPSTIIHSSPYNRCIQTAELFLKYFYEYSKTKLNQSNETINKSVKLRIDQALSEWLNENFSLKYLPPNDDGYSMISNINNYLNESLDDDDTTDTKPLNQKTRYTLKTVKDQIWSYNQFGHCGEYGESSSDFKKRCFQYLVSLLQYYYKKNSFTEDKDTVIVIVSHGAVISALLRVILNKPIFNEIPICTPIYLKQNENKRSVFRFMDYDFNLSSILPISNDQDLYKLLKSDIDFTSLDYDTIYDDYELNSTIITVNSPVAASKEKDEGNQTKNETRVRPRSNTFELGSSTVKNEERGNLRQTNSSKQLHLMNKETNEEKIIDLDKLRSFFAGFSDSDTNSDSDSDSNSDSDSTFQGELNIKVNPRVFEKNKNENSVDKIVDESINSKLTNDQKDTHITESNDSKKTKSSTFPEPSITGLSAGKHSHIGGFFKKHDKLTKLLRHSPISTVMEAKKNHSDSKNSDKSEFSNDLKNNTDTIEEEEDSETLLTFAKPDFVHISGSSTNIHKNKSLNQIALHQSPRLDQIFNHQPLGQIDGTFSNFYFKTGNNIESHNKSFNDSNQQHSLSPTNTSLLDPFKIKNPITLISSINLNNQKRVDDLSDKKTIFEEEEEDNNNSKNSNKYYNINEQHDSIIEENDEVSPHSSRSSNDESELFVPLFSSAFSKRRKSGISESSSSDKEEKNSLSSSQSISKLSREKIKSILNRQYDNSFLKSEEDVGWFGSSFQRQKV